MRRPPQEDGSSDSALNPGRSRSAFLSRFPQQWQALLESRGEPAYRAVQVFRWVHRHGVFSPEQMTNLTQGLRQYLSDDGVGEPGRVCHVHRALDGTKKLLIEFEPNQSVECVLIPMTKALEDQADASAVDEEEQPASSAADSSSIATAEHNGAAPGARARQRITLCLSTQLGCAMGCVFCASGQAGLRQSLSAAEVVGQVLLAKRYLEPHQDLRNLVFMGMGEPLHHYRETAHAIQLLTHPEGLNISPRRITVSTVGLVPKIRQLGLDFQGKVGLAISLHAPNDALRDKLLPINRRYPLAVLLQALREYPLPKRRRITIEYTLIHDQNDKLEHARELGRLLRGLRVKVNLIPMNRVANSPLYAAETEQVQLFQKELSRQGYSCFIRTRRGDDVAAACGQLAYSRTLAGTGSTALRVLNR